MNEPAEGSAVAHPAPAEVEAFLRGRLSPVAVREIASHLLVCRDCAESLAPTAVALHTPRAAKPSAAGGEYEFPIFRACALALRHAAALAEARRAVGSRGQAPASRPPAAAESAVDRGLRGWARAEVFLDAARWLRHRDPHGMLLLARLAGNLAAGLDPVRCGGAPLHADLQARALLELANSYRVVGDFARSEAAFLRALDLAARGSRDPLLVAALADRAASLFVAQRRFAEAFRLLDAVHDLYRSLGDLHLAGRALVSKGLHAGYAGYPEQALELLSAGLKSIEPQSDPMLFAAAIHNTLLFTIDCGRFLTARRLLRDARRLTDFYGEPLNALRLRALEGRIACGLGDLDAAERAFDEVRRGFVDRALPYAAAIVTLDLLAVWLRQGRAAEIRAQVDELLATFQAFGIRREAIATLLVLRRAIEREQASLGLLRTVASRLERIESGTARQGAERR